MNDRNTLADSKKRQCQQINCKFQKVDRSQVLRLYCESCYNNQEKMKQFRKQQLINRKNELQEQLQNLINTNSQGFSQYFEEQRVMNENLILFQKIGRIQNRIKNNKKQLVEINNNISIVSLNKKVDNLRISMELVEQKVIQYQEEKVQKKEEIEKKTSILRRRQQILFTSIPFLDDQKVYKNFRLCDEIQQLTFLQYDHFGRSVTFFESSSLDQSFIDVRRFQQQEICLALKKSIYEWKSYFSENKLYYEFLITAIQKTFMLVYYLSSIFNIPLPYPMYIDYKGYPQFYQYKIFEEQQQGKLMKFQESSITQVQINIYQILYNLNISLDSRGQKYFDILDLIQQCYGILKPWEPYLKGLCSEYCRDDIGLDVRRKRKLAIPIKLVNYEMNKFNIEGELHNNSDEFEIIN